jgi:hypothetical protein
VLLQGEYSNSPPERIDRLTNSFGSDLVYAVSRGKIKPKKHILLPFTVKSLTGNVEMIQTLNRLGHGVSYSQVEEIDTALCLQKMATCETTSHYQEIFFQCVHNTCLGQHRSSGGNIVRRWNFTQSQWHSNPKLFHWPNASNASCKQVNYKDQEAEC